jgi:hypothetical protein
MAPVEGFTEDMARYFVDFIDDLYAEQALESPGARTAMFYAHSRLDGAFSLVCLVEGSEAAIGVLAAARERYLALMQGAGVESQGLRDEHVRCAAEVRRRRLLHA